jgi:biotin carboxyl carrier protein
MPAVSADGVVRSPSVGRVVEVLVDVGAAVAADEEVAVVESMKVEIPVVAPRAGRVATVAVTAGDQVQAGDPLLVLAPLA